MSYHLTFATLSYVVQIYLIGKLYSIKKRTNIIFFKNEIEYIVRAHPIKTNVSLVSTGQMKRLINESKLFVLLVVKQKEDDISNALVRCDPYHK
jgi:hypothetical protein